MMVCWPMDIVDNDTEYTESVCVCVCVCGIKYIHYKIVIQIAQTSQLSE